MKNMKLFDNVKEVLNKFGPEILSGAAIIFTGLAIVETMRKAEEAVETKKEFDEKIETETQKEEPDTKEIKNLKINKTVRMALIYKWSLIFGVGSAVCMICSTKLSGSKLAAAYALAKLNEDKLKLALEKSKELLGEEKAKDLECKIANSLAEKNDIPFDGDDKLNPEEEFFIDKTNGNWIIGTRENIEKAAKNAEAELSRNHTLSYGRWLYILGHPYPYEADVANTGWNTFRPFKMHIEDRKLDNKMYHYIVYENAPVENFRELRRFQTMSSFKQE